ncbi:hypothetical protein QTP70_033418, partial [Hemibagrus guttatus]
CVPANGVTVEEVLLGIGKETGYDSISSASRMNKAVVVFVKEESHELDVLFRVGYEGRTYMVYASTGNMKCFECGDVGHKRLACPHKAQASEEAPSQGNERATRLGRREETRQGDKEEAVQGSKEEAVQGSKEEAVQGSKEEDGQETEEEDEQDGGVQQSTEGDGRLNIEESTITDKVAGEMEEADDVMSEVDEVSGSEGVTGATGENRGRVLVVNNLAASTLWHKTNVMELPEELVSSIQRSIVDFFWSGQHWLPAAVLYLPVQEGGQGLVDVRSRIRAFRIQAAQRLLYHKDVVWEKTAGAILRRVGGFRLDKHLFLMELKELSLSELTPYYRSMLHMWRTVIRTERDMDNLEQWTTEEPLFFNPCMQSRVLSSVSIHKCLLGNGITKLGHLLNEEGWIPTEELKAVTGLRSSRLAAKLQEELCNTLPSSYRTYIGQRHGNTQDRKSDEEFPGLRILPTVRTEEEDAVTDFFKVPQTSLKGMTKKGIYHITVKVLHKESLKRQKASKWPGMLNPDFLVRDRGRTLYKPPVEKRTTDLQWRIIHGAVATDRHVAHLDPAVKGECRFCGEKEDLEHLVLKCQRLKGLFKLLKSWFQKFDEEFSEKVFILFIPFLEKEKTMLIKPSDWNG